MTEMNKIFNMKIFNKLPIEIKDYILLFNEHFIMRKGEIISIIPKSDYRYNLLKIITFKLDCVEYYGGELKCRHYFHNLHDYEERQQNNSDLIQVDIKENEDSIKYSVWIGKQYQKSVKSNKTQIYHIENPLEYNWIYTEYKYIRT